MRRLLLPLTLLAHAACESPTIPPHSTADIYDFRLESTPPAVLRWPSGTSVRVHIAGSGGERRDQLAGAFAIGAAEWNRHALYGEYELARASSLRGADVVLRWSDESPPVDMAECEPVISIAVTTFCLSDDEPGRLRAFPLLPPDDGVASSVRFVITILGSQSGNDATVRRLVTHELGHALGIARHSLNTQDLMAPGVPTRDGLSLRDIATVQILYHTRPEITP